MKEKCFVSHIKCFQFQMLCPYPFRTLLWPSKAAKTFLYNYVNGTTVLQFYQWTLYGLETNTMGKQKIYIMTSRRAIFFLAWTSGKWRSLRPIHVGHFSMISSKRTDISNLHNPLSNILSDKSEIWDAVLYQSNQVYHAYAKRNGWEMLNNTLRSLNHKHDKYEKI